MPFKTFTDDQVLTSDDVNRYWVQQFSIIKSVDETIISSTVTQADNELVAPVLANTQYLVECLVFYDFVQAADIKIGFSAPAGSTFDWVSNGLVSAATGTVGDVVKRYRALADVEVCGGPAAASGTSAVLPIEGRLVTGGTAGNLTFNWAQNTSTATTCTVSANSVLMLQRLTV